MLQFEKGELCPGVVVWANTVGYYDCSDTFINKKRMYVIVKEMPKDFLGCPITSNDSKFYNTHLSKDIYPLRLNSRVKECIYNTPKADICSSKTFKLEEKTFEYLKRTLYERITIGKGLGKCEYNEMFVNDYLKEYIPKVNDVIEYPMENMGYKYYYIYSMDEDNYELIELSKEDRIYSVIGDEPILMNKSVRFFACRRNHNLTREIVDESLKGTNVKIKKLIY